MEPLIRLGLAPGVGPVRATRLIDHFGSAERVLAASDHDLLEVGMVGPGLVARIGRARGKEVGESAKGALVALERMGAVGLTVDDALYPESFLRLPDPPYLLFAVGDPGLLAARSFAVVGTRKPTSYGRETARQLAGGLARAGYAIVSGMARGIDAVAQQAALDAGGATVGVLGHGVDRVYPEANRQLFERVRREGLLISELMPGMGPLAGNFPRRNRLIASLGEGVLVVEMARRSGAQHTVNYALSQGKEVFAVPGPIAAEASEGTNQLIKDGACVVTAVEDILDELGTVPGPAPERGPPPPAIHPPPAPKLPAEEARLYAALAREPRHVDELAADSGLAPRAVLALLLSLELEGHAEALPGKLYRKRGG